MSATFLKGDNVRFTVAFRQMSRRNHPVFGVVAADQKRPEHVSVIAEGNKYPSSFHVRFVERYRKGVPR